MSAELNFGLLGPLLVHADEVVVPVPRGRERATLAVLLLNAGQLVSADQLIEALWGQSPPLSARVTIRNYVMRLRRALGDAGAARIRTHPPGYWISVEKRELDVFRFEAMLASAKEAAASSSWKSAAGQAAEALALWRGEPLADVDSEALAVQEVPRLRELRLQAFETRIEADLQLGSHNEVVAELCRLVATHPLREHLHVLLMCALYRSGRQADALAAYQHAREILIDELGAEPGPEMRDLHKRILSADPDLDWQVGGGAGVTVTAPAEPPDQVDDGVPRQLPAMIRHFTGRQGELRALADVLGQDGTGPATIYAIDGMAGIGKTALAIQAAHQLSGQFPDGQLFLDLHGCSDGRDPRRPDEALEWLLRALGVPMVRIPQEAEEKAALYRQRLAAARTLIVLDNASSEEQVRPLLPGGGGCLVLVTSRRRLKGLDDARVLALDVLPHADAQTLLRAVAGPQHVAAGDPVLAEVASLCGQLPLALRIAAALLRHRPAWTLDDLAGLLRDQRRRLAALSDGERDLAAALDLSYRNMPGDWQAMFRRLGLLPGPDADAYAAAALAGTDPASATRTLEGLVDHNLLIQHVPGRYRLHDLIRLYAGDQLAKDCADDRDAALHRLLDYYQHTAARAEVLIARFSPPELSGPVPDHMPPMPGPDAARAWLRAECPNLLAAAHDATSHGRHQRLIALTAGLATLLRTDGPGTRPLNCTPLPRGRRAPGRIGSPRLSRSLG